LSTGQLIVTIASVGLLGALHLVLRAARAPAGAASVVGPPAGMRRDLLVPALVLAALAALAFAGIAFVVSVVDDEDATAPSTQATTAPATTTAPPPAQLPPPAPASLEPPAGTELVARMVVQPEGAVATARNRFGQPPRVIVREEGVYAVIVPGLSPELRRRAVVRVRPADGTPGVLVSARKVGPRADFVVFTRDAQTGGFAQTGYEFALFVPQQDVEGAAGEGEEGDGRPVLPPTR
jgi:hypothetical protein